MDTTNKNAQAATTAKGTDGTSAIAQHKDNTLSVSNSVLPPNCDIFTYRALFKQLEDEHLDLFQRKLSKYKRLETDLGRPGIFDWPEAQAKQLHEDYADLKRELNHLVAIKDYLEGLTDFAIESWSKLSERGLFWEVENSDLRARCRSHSKNEFTLISAISDLYEIIESLQTRLYNSPNNSGNETGI